MKKYTAVHSLFRSIFLCLRHLSQRIRAVFIKLRVVSARLHAPNSIYLGNHIALTQTYFGAKMYVDTRDRSIAPFLLLNGYWEKWISIFFISVLKRGMTVVDIGANLGYYSIMAGARVGSSGKLYCFEANPQIFSILADNIHLNGLLTRTKLINKAVYSRQDTLDFYCAKKYMGSSSLDSRLDKSLHDLNDSAVKTSVESISLDNYFIPGTRVDLLKMDAEGAEYEILQGASRILRENKHLQIIMEYSSPMLGKDAAPLLEYLENLGFMIYSISQDSRLKKESVDGLLKTDLTELYLTRKEVNPLQLVSEVSGRL